MTRTVTLTQDEIDYLMNFMRHQQNMVHALDPNGERYCRIARSLEWKLTGPVPPAPAPKPEGD